MEEKKNAFEILNSINVNEHTEVKDTGKAKLTYLSWAWAWAEVKKRYPSVSYEIIKFNGLPYVFDEKTGYMVYTTVTIEGITHEMWLPVMDGNNRAMLDHPYEVQTKYNKFTVQAATMFDVNKAIMRCLTKNLAMFGLGLYIYAGEDLPEVEDEDETTKKVPQKKAVKQEKPAKDQTEQNQNKNEDPEKVKARAAYQKLIEYCRDNEGYIDLKHVVEKCTLNANSTAHDFEMALIYAQTQVVTGGEG